MSIIQLAPGLKQIEINLWNPISIIICAWQYKNKSCSIRFGGLMSHSSTNWWIECYCRILPFFFSFTKKICKNPSVLMFKYFLLLPLWNQDIYEQYEISGSLVCSCCHPILFSAHRTRAAHFVMKCLQETMEISRIEGVQNSACAFQTSWPRALLQVTKALCNIVCNYR